MEPFHSARDVEHREHLIETASRLFAALGYDATPITTIADASGFDLPTITALVGDKPTLYRSVMARVHAEQRAVFDTIMEEFTPDGTGLHLLVDRALNHCVAHPELPALWMHRWQSDAADIPELERTHLQPELERFRALLREHTPAETDVDMALHNIAWCIRGFCTGGVITSEGQREGPENPILLNRFRQHLYHLTDVLFKLR